MLAGFFQKSRGLEGIPSAGSKGNLDGFVVESRGSGGKGVVERAWFQKGGNVSLEFVVEASPDSVVPADGGDGNAYTRVVLSAVLAGAENSIVDSHNAVVLGGSYNAVEGATNVVLAGVDGLRIDGAKSLAFGEGRERQYGGYVDETCFVPSLQLRGGFRSLETVFAPFLVGSEETERAEPERRVAGAPLAVRRELGPEDYLVVVDPVREVSEGGVKGAERVELALPRKVDGAPNQQLVIRLADKQGGGSGVFVGLPEAPRGDDVPTFVTCHRNYVAERVVYASAAEAWAQAVGATEGGAATDAYAVYVRCMQDPRKEQSAVRYRRETVTIATETTCLCKSCSWGPRIARLRG
jgi:hypothetical protein